MNRPDSRDNTSADHERFEQELLATDRDAAGRRETDADIDTSIDRHSVAGLATALTYAAARERGEVTHRLITVRYDTRGVEVAATLADRLHGWPIGRGSVDVVCDCPPRPHGRST
jgi:hypothetical protein